MSPLYGPATQGYHHIPFVKLGGTDALITNLNKSQRNPTALFQTEIRNINGLLALMVSSLGQNLSHRLHTLTPFTGQSNPNQVGHLFAPLSERAFYFSYLKVFFHLVFEKIPGLLGIGPPVGRTSGKALYKRETIALYLVLQCPLNKRT